MAAAADSPASAAVPVPLASLLLQPWIEAGRRPPLAWLTPQPRVRLVHADGRETLWAGDRCLGEDAQRRRGARFVALELPPELHLERRIELPPMSPEDRRSALELHARAACPFETDDLAWGHREDRGSGGRVDCTLLMASRAGIRQHLEARAAAAGTDRPEVWGFDADHRPVVLQGFGEAARLRHVAQGRRLALALLALGLLLGAAAAVTPTLQIEARARQAEASSAELERRLAPVLAQREAMVRAQADREALREQMGERVEPLQVIELLTSLVPDDTWVQRVQVQGGRVTLTGQTPNTSALMNTLGAHSLVRDVKAPVAATRALGGKRENFTIELMLAPDALRPAGAASGAGRGAALSASPAAGASPVPAGAVAAASAAAAATAASAASAAPLSPPPTAAGPVAAAAAPPAVASGGHGR